MQKRSQQLSKHAKILLGLLVIQYIFGMISNLFITLPVHADKNLGLKDGQWVVWTHILIGTIIVISAISLYVRASKAKDRIWKLVGGVTSGAVILAWMSGDEFLNSPDNGYSLAMSLFFIIAFVTLGWGIYRTKDKK